MKFVRFILVIVMCVAATGACADNWFVALQGGAGIANDQDYKSSDKYKTTFGTSTGASFAFGSRSLSWRWDLQFCYLQLPINKYLLNGRELLPASVKILKLPKQYEYYGVLFNVYYDFKFDYFRPYLGFSIGMVSAPDEIYPFESTGKKRSMSAGGVTAGLSYPLNKQLELL